MTDLDRKIAFFARGAPPRTPLGLDAPDPSKGCFNIGLLAPLEGGMVNPEIAKTTEPKQSTPARGVYELCGGLGEPILYHTYEKFPGKYPKFLFWA